MTTLDRPTATRPTPATAPFAAAARRAGSPLASSPIRASLTFGHRALLKIKHVPEQLVEVVSLPVMFTVAFTYLFGGARAGSTSTYLQSLLPGSLAMTVLLLSVFGAVGVNLDVSTGVMDRYRSMPVWRAAPLFGTLLGDVVRNVLATALVIGLGLLMGFRPDAGVVGVLLAIGLLLVFAMGISWVWMFLALSLRSPQAVNNVGLMALFPLTMASNVFVDPTTTPGWLEAFIAVNPVSHLVTASRGLMHGTATAGDVALVLAIAAGLIATFGTLSIWRFRRLT